MNIFNFVLLISLVAGCVYNIDNSIVRMLLIVMWFILPLVMLVLSTKTNVKYSAVKLLSHSLIIIFLLLVCFFVNIDTLSFELDGPNVEKLTPFLFFFHVLILMYFFSMPEIEYKKKFITYFMLAITFIMISDMLARYIEAPGYFMNYNTRHQAKTVGFFSTTNVNGQILAFLLVLSVYLKFQYKRAIQIILFAVLITTMARSAIVALFVTVILQHLIERQGLVWRMLSFILVSFIILLFIIDPFNFKSDGSLLSKIQFFRATYNLIDTSSLTSVIFGYGASYDAITSAINVNGWSPHVAILKAFLYYGVIGVFIYAYILFSVYRLDRRMLMPIGAYLIFSLAGAPIFWPALTSGVILIKINQD